MNKVMYVCKLCAKGLMLDLASASDDTLAQYTLDPLYIYDTDLGLLCCECHGKIFQGQRVVEIIDEEVDEM